jgi:hypothetical protein
MAFLSGWPTARINSTPPLPTSSSSASPSHQFISPSFQIPLRLSRCDTRTRLTSSRPSTVNPTIAHGRRARPGGRRRQGRGLLVLRPPAFGAAAPAGPAAAAVRVRHVPGLPRWLGRVPAAARRVPTARPAARIRQRRRRLSQPAALRARGAVLRGGLPGCARYGVLSAAEIAFARAY